MTWRDAWSAALYGPEGFYRAYLPADHFRTSVHASPQFSRAILQLVRRTGATAVTDYGAGSGELLAQLASSAPDLSLTAVEVRPRPESLPDQVAWVTELPDQIEGLLIANELLDNVPCQLVERAEDAWRVVEVHSESGEERLGAEADEEDMAWLARWWPDHALGQVGQRVEVGLARDRLWADACARVTVGTSLAIDYGHLADYRPVLSTVRSYRAGRETSLSLDGHHDISAHVAIDSVAAAVGAETARQRDMLYELGLTTMRPDVSLASTDPVGYVHALSLASEAGELLASPGLGDLLWVMRRHP
jgi:SAM-dependent MidA family methyltransferase